MQTVQRAPIVRFITMGCAKNEVDTDAMRAQLESAGFVVEGKGQQDLDPDVVVVNTCSFITEATQESIDVILEVAAARDDAIELGGDGPKIVVSGCMPSRYGEELAQEMPEVDAFVNVDDEGSIVKILSDILGYKPSAYMEEARTVQAPYAYVKISDGCDRFCSFCTIPYIRGRYFSRHASEIIEEIDYLVKNGTREIVLIGQDTGIWGDDLSDPSEYAPLESPSLANLMRCIAQTFPNTWIRVMYLQPERTSDELLSVIRDYDNVCSYLDIPLQHASARIIHDMNRKGSGHEYLELLNHVRRMVDGITIRTTMISGFPGETDEDAQELVDFIESADFDYAGVFEYSREDGTVAGEREDQVPHEISEQRAQRVRDAADVNGFSRASARVGNIYDVLVCGIDDGSDDLADEFLLDEEFRPRGTGSAQYDNINNAPRTAVSSNLGGAAAAGARFSNEDSSVGSGVDSNMDSGVDSSPNSGVDSNPDSRVDISSARGEEFADSEHSNAAANIKVDNSAQAEAEYSVSGVGMGVGKAESKPAKPGYVRMWGRAQFQAPDVDSIITFDAPESCLGTIVPVKITGAIGYDLEGDVQI